MCILQSHCIAVFAWKCCRPLVRRSARKEARTPHACDSEQYPADSATEVFWHSGALQIGLLLLLLLLLLLWYSRGPCEPFAARNLSAGSFALLWCSKWTDTGRNWTCYTTSSVNYSKIVISGILRVSRARHKPGWAPSSFPSNILLRPDRTWGF